MNSGGGTVLSDAGWCWNLFIIEGEFVSLNVSVETIYSLVELSAMFWKLELTNSPVSNSFRKIVPGKFLAFVGKERHLLHKILKYKPGNSLYFHIVNEATLFMILSSLK